jgi:hypothetical protein
MLKEDDKNVITKSLVFDKKIKLLYNSTMFLNLVL